MMEEYIWLFDRNEHGELAGSILGSVIFHALMFVILASTPIFHPLPGESDNVDILWYYPSMTPKPYLGRPGKTVTATAKTAETKHGEKTIATGLPPVKIKPRQTTPAKTSVPASSVEHPIPPPASSKNEAADSQAAVLPDEEPEMEDEPEMTIPAAIDTQPETRIAAIPAEKIPVKSVAEPENRKEASPTTETVNGEAEKPPPSTDREAQAEEFEPPHQQAVAEAAKPSPEKDATTPIAAKNGPSPNPTVHRAETAAAVPSAQAGVIKKKAEQSTPADTVKSDSTVIEESKSEAAAPQRTPLSEVIVPVIKVPPTEKKVAPLPTYKPSLQVNTKVEPRPGAAEAKGIFFPPLKGDLKLEISGKDEMLEQIKVVVLFREFSNKRRNRPLTKAEYGQTRTLNPRLYKSGESSRQAVIEIADDGIYEFMVESASEQPETAEFTLKIHEKSSKRHTKPLGSRQIAGRECIAKVLMPEGILWSEDSAFSGSIEGSDGVTKFNTDTGLVWKEYK